MKTLFSWFFRILLFFVGLAVAAVLMLVILGLLGVWLLRAAWLRLTGREVRPFVTRLDPRAAMGSVLRRRQQPPSDGASRWKHSDVTDVKPK